MRARVILPVIALLGLGLAACGDDGPNQTGSTSNSNPPPAATAPANPTPPASTTPAPGAPTTPARP